MAEININLTVEINPKDVYNEIKYQFPMLNKWEITKYFYDNFREIIKDILALKGIDYSSINYDHGITELNDELEKYVVKL